MTALPYRHLALAVLVAAMWGLNNTVAKFVVEHVPPLFAASARFTMQGLMLSPWLLQRRQRWRPLLLVGLISGPIHFALLYTGLARAEHIAPLAITLQMWIPFATLLAMPLLGERPTAAIWCGLGLAFLGLAVMTFDPRLFADIDGVSLCLAATFCWGLSAVLSRKIGGLPAIPLQAWVANLVWPPLLLASLFTEPTAMTAAGSYGWAPFLGLCLFSALSAGIIGNGLMFWLVQRHPVNQVTPIMLLAPIVTIGAGVVMLGEPITLRVVIGTVLTIGGLALVTILGRARPAPTAIDA